MGINYSELSQNDFLKWALVKFVTDLRSEHDFNVLTKATNNFTDIQLEIKVNGIKVNSESFLKSIEESIDAEVDKKFQLKFQEFTAFSELGEKVRQVEFELRVKLAKMLQEKGIEVNLDGDY